MTRDEFMDLVGADYVDEYEKAQLSQEGTTKDATSDLISRQAAITALSHMCSEDEKGITVSRANVESMLKSLLPAQPEEAIPLAWISAQIERLKGMDNLFADLTADIIQTTLNEWRKEQEGETE